MARERDRRGAGVAQWQAKGAPAYLQQETTTSRSSSSSSSSMKDPLSRTKVVIRRLPPTLTEKALVSRIQAKCPTPYLWMHFRPGKSTLRNQIHSRAYIELSRPEDVIAFHHHFDGHVFVNDKGSQYKAVVEYAPYQRVPDLRAKRDGREGSIWRDSDYLEFVDTVGKTIDLPSSADVQPERPASFKDGVIVTPLMEYVRQKRAAKSAQRSSKAGFRSASIMGPAPSGFVIQKRGEKGKAASSAENAKEMYIRREHKRRASEFRERKLNREPGEDVASNGHLKDADETPAGDGQCADFKPVDADVSRSARKLKDKSDSGYSSRGRPPVSPGQQSPSSYKHASSGRASKLQAVRQSAPEAESDSRRLRNKDRPDRPVWTPRRRLDSAETEVDTAARVGNEPENEGDGKTENGSYRRKVPRDPEHVPVKRGVTPSFGSTEKQVWVAVQRTG